MLKPKSRQVLDIIAGNPKLSAKKAYQEVHETSNDRTAITNAYKLLRKPESQIYLQKHTQLARQQVVRLAQEAKNENVQLSASQDILDREYGKPTQRTEVHSTKVSVTLNLAGKVDSPS